MKNLYVFSLLTAIFLISCNNNETQELELRNTTDNRLKLVGKYELSIPEPSGLSLTNYSDTLWTVSDENSLLYKITTHGQVIDSFKVNGSDLEGVVNFSGKNVCIVTERDRGILLLDSLFNLTERVLLDIPGDLNTGIEGVTYNSSNNHFYIVTEKNPSLLIELDEKYAILNRYELNYAKDFSGIHYDSSANCLWIISDESQSLFKTNLKGEVLDQYKIDIPQIEGIDIDWSRRLLYIVSDNTECLYVFMIRENEVNEDN